MNDRSRWLVLAALGLLLIALSNSHFTFFHGGFRLFGINPLMTAILLAVVIWFLLDRCGGRSTSQTAPTADADLDADPDADPDAAADNADSSEHENGEDEDKTS